MVLSQFNTEVLPALSVANVRELLRAVMPLKQLTAEQATEPIIEHLLNRGLVILLYTLSQRNRWLELEGR